jgi:hypothetical protein
MYGSDVFEGLRDFTVVGVVAAQAVNSSGKRGV